MGDRANVYIRNDAEHGVYLYTHWAGTELPETVRRALARGRDRWNDDPYLARIIFCEMTADPPSATTGYDISAHISDNSYPIVYVDCERMAIGFAEPPRARFGRQDPPRTWIPFAEYVARGTATWPRPGELAGSVSERHPSER